MPWTLKAANMLGILTALSITLPPTTESVVFFGVRGALPTSNTDKATSVDLDGSKPINHETMRCAIGQWFPSQEKLTIYRGSTVPTLRYVERAADRGGKGANLLLPGLYTFIQGEHRAGTPTGHAAFRELGDKLICRTSDDGEYEPDSDLVEIDTPCDNLHAAWGEESFSSAGCQVVSGKPGEGQWKVFKDRGYVARLGLSRIMAYRYLLLPSSTWVHLTTTTEPAIVIGSRGDRASAVQDALIERGFLKGQADGIFGCQSGLALLKFQRQRPEIAATAICTATVAGLLGIKDW